MGTVASAQYPLPKKDRILMISLNFRPEGDHYDPLLRLHTAAKDADAASFTARHPWRDGRLRAGAHGLSASTTLCGLASGAARAPSHSLCRPPMDACLAHRHSLAYSDRPTSALR